MRIVGNVIIALLCVLACVVVYAHDDGQWGNETPEIRSWYAHLMQPDHPEVSCCGQADAYWCDEVHVENGRTYCQITDDRPDAPRHRPHIALGTQFEIPPNKLKHDAGNPTGHFIIFLSVAGYVYCFVQGSGV